jgi:hypothetical protein
VTIRLNRVALRVGLGVAIVVVAFLVLRSHWTHVPSRSDMASALARLPYQVSWRRETVRGVDVYRGTARSSRGVTIRFAAVVGKDAAVECDRLPQPIVKGAFDGSVPFGDAPIVFYNSTDSLPPSPTRSASYDIELTIEKALFATVKGWP